MAQSENSLKLPLKYFSLQPVFEENQSHRFDTLMMSSDCDCGQCGCGCPNEDATFAVLLAASLAIYAGAKAVGSHLE